MSTINLVDLLKETVELETQWDRPITGLSLDTRTLKKGDLFFAYPGTQQDGRDFIEEALEKGAAAVLMEGSSKKITEKNSAPVIQVPQLIEKIGFLAARFYGEPSKDIQVIGITGTNGKTSCSQFLAAALQKAGISCAVMGTLGNGIEGQLTSSVHTTPDPIATQQFLAEFRDQGIKAVAMEVSSHALDQHRVNGVHFDIGIFTNLTRDHLDYHGDMVNYAAAKRKLFEQPGMRHGIVNADDVFGQTLMQESHDGLEWHSYSITGANSTIVAKDASFDDEGIHAKVFSPWGGGELHSPLYGRFNLANLLAVFTTLCVLDVPFKQAFSSLSELVGVPGRMQALGGGDKPLIVVDYAHTPDALQQALSALRRHCNGDLWCVFGCGGNRDRGKRELMGQIAERLADSVVITDDNPRKEDPSRIVEDILTGLNANRSVVAIEHSRRKAIAYAIEKTKPGDVVLVAGKGHETFQEMGNEKHPFSDVDVVQEALGISSPV